MVRGGGPDNGRREMRRVLAIVLASACVPALADLVPIGDPQGGHSWEQRFGESGSGAFDLLGVRMASADDFFKSPAHNDFSQEGWSLELDGLLLASASGNSLSSLEWDIYFSGDTSSPLAFDYVTFSSDKLVSAARAEWGAGRGWTITPFPGGEGAFWLPPPGDLEGPIPAPG